MCHERYSHSPENGVGESGQDSTDHRANDRDPGISPIAVTLALDWQNGVGDTGREVTGRVDGISGGPTKGGTDGDNEQTDSQGANFHSLGEAGEDDPQHKDPGADGLSDGIPQRVADFRAGSEGTELEGCLLYTSPSPRDRTRSRMPSSA